jgi:hypothetical protein
MFDCDPATSDDWFATKEGGLDSDPLQKLGPVHEP